MKYLISLLSILGLISASLFGNSDLDNFSVLAHVAGHQVENHGHHHDEGHHHDHGDSTQKAKSTIVFSISHQHESSNSGSDDSEPHEHHLNISPSFIAFVVDATPFNWTNIGPSEPLAMEPNQLISGLYREPLFRPPIS